MRLLLLLLLAFAPYAQAVSKPVEVKSPDRSIVLAFDIDSEGHIVYRLSKDKEAVIDWSVTGFASSAGSVTNATRLDAVGHYPDPEAQTLQALIAARCGIEPACVAVTNGATEAIYLIAECWQELPAQVTQPTFSEYADACALFHIKQGTGGKIVSMASMLAWSGGIRVPSYAASKHGIAGITKAFANE